MRLHLLKFDEAFALQDTFVEICRAARAEAFDGRKEAAKIRLWGRESDLKTLSRLLASHFRKGGPLPRLCFMGSGDFHHVTALLVQELAAHTTEKFTIIHFDNHPDWVGFKDGMHCGSWVNRALSVPNVAKIITLGICSNDLKSPERKRAQLAPMADGRLEVFPFDHPPTRVKLRYGRGAGYRQRGRHIHWRKLAHKTMEDFISLVLSRIDTDAVYITVDKDVLSQDEANTNWDQGQMPLAWLVNAIEAIGKRHHILGADVTGDYSPPHYSGPLWQRTLKRAEIFLDQPRRAPALRSAANINGAVNEALLSAFAKVMA